MINASNGQCNSGTQMFLMVEFQSDVGVKWNTTPISVLLFASSLCYNFFCLFVLWSEYFSLRIFFKMAEQHFNRPRELILPCLSMSWTPHLLGLAYACVEDHALWVRSDSACWITTRSAIVEGSFSSACCETMRSAIVEGSLTWLSLFSKGMCSSQNNN